MNRISSLFAALAAVFMSGIEGSVAGQGISFSLPSAVQVEIVEAPFNKASSKVVGCDGNGRVCLINDHVPFGAADGIPKTYAKSITVSYQKHHYSLDVSDMYNAWGARPLEVKGAVRYFGGRCFDAKNCRLRGLFSDAAGSFVAEWWIVNGVSIRTILTDSNDVVMLFARHIDPPEFD